MVGRGGGGGFGGGGGGFRGGGFRGGGGGFRVGNVRSSGRPFGRTGARRTTSRSPRGSNYSGRHHYSYYGGYYRPWYRRHYWWWGYPYRPWYYGPVYWGGGLAVFIIALLVIIPLIGLFTIPYPSNTTEEGTITYRDTQTLFYNEYWFEKEHMKEGSTISYNVQSQSPVSFIIWDQPFENFPTSSGLRTGNYQGTFSVTGNDNYEYYSLFMHDGDVVNFDFTVSGGNIEFFITDANNLNRWNNWEDITPDYSNIVSSGDNGTFTVPYTQDWYLVWYNTGSTSIEISLIVIFDVAALDFSTATLAIENIDLVPLNELPIDSSGDYYFFIYFDPFNNPAESVDITFDISYNTGVTHNQQWQNVTPILFVIGIIVLLILVIALFQRNSAKKQVAESSTSSTVPTRTQRTTSREAVTPSIRDEASSKIQQDCHRCGIPYKIGDVYCSNCGAKLVGRDYGISKVNTPFDNKSNCINCKFPLAPDSLFCKNCGTRVEQSQ